MLYDMNMGTMLIGCLLNQPSLLFLPQYPLCKADFDPCRLHQIIYLAITRLANLGVQDVTGIEVESIVKSHPVQMEILQDNNYLDFIYNAKELAQITNYEYYWKTIRKFALLREMQAKGFDITDFYDELGDEPQEREKLDKCSIQSIINSTEYNLLKLKSKYDVKYVREEMKAGEDTEELLNFFEETPAFGALLQSGYLSTLYQGWCRGHLLLRSAPSGTAKTRMGVADLVNVGVKEIWNSNINEFVVNENYQGPTFFIHTEMATKENINPMFLAAVSGVDYNKIVKGKCNKSEKARIIKAGDLLLDSNIQLIDMPDFTNRSLERKVKQLVEGEGVVYGVFDYVQMQGELASEYKTLTNMPIREDLILKNTVLTLKSMAEKYHIGILSMTQLNDEWKKMKFPDESCLSGSKAMKDKLDGGSIVIMTKERPKEFAKIEPWIIQSSNYVKDKPPNMVEYIYKARFGEFGDQKIKIWTYFDRGTFQRIDYFCTDMYDNFVDVPVSKLGGQ